MESRKRGAPLLLGAHLSIAGGIPKAVERAKQLRCTALQIFVKNNNRWVGRPLGEGEVREFRRLCKESPLAAVVAHACYLINLASPDAELWERSVQALLDELERCDRLGLDCLIVHPGAHVGEGEAAGIRRVIRALREIHSRRRKRRAALALETTAGQGSSLGYRFEHLRDILGGCPDVPGLCVCLDSCHVFAAGYDVSSPEGYARTMEEFDRLIGLQRLKVLHLNDSKRELGSRVDRHEHIGKGRIGRLGFALMVRDRKLQAIPKIIETPKEKGKADQRNLALLRRLAGSG